MNGRHLAILVALTLQLAVGQATPATVSTGSKLLAPTHISQTAPPPVESINTDCHGNNHCG